MTRQPVADGDPDARIEVRALRKSYGEVAALNGIDLRAGAGEVLGVLGHNGAGKTTLVDILTTGTRPTSGKARICGLDVVRAARAVRHRIGRTAQLVALDEDMSARASLVLFARLLGATRRQATQRAAELIETFALTEIADRPARTYSGGQRRRADLACGMAGTPDVLFLDEPSTGLDPASRAGLWELVRGLAAAGTTVLLTTQYLEEVDRLAHQVVVLGAGHVVATGTPDELKARLGARTARLTSRHPGDAELTADLLRQYGFQVHHETGRPQVQVSAAEPGDVLAIIRILDRTEIPVLDLTVAEPSLEEAYLALWHGSETVPR